MRARWPIIVALLVALASPAAASGKSDKAADPSRHVALAPITVTVFRDARVRGMLSVELTLELADPAKREALDKIMPRLRDRYIAVLTQLAANRVDVRRPVDVGGVAEALQATTDRLLGPQSARVLVGGATVRRL